MSVRVEILDKGHEAEYESRLLTTESALLYASLSFRSFLEKILDSSKAFYLAAYDNGQMVGAIPAFAKYNAVHGTVLNSLPFYGSNGGPIVFPGTICPSTVATELMNAFDEIARTEKTASSTAVSNPLASPMDFPGAPGIRVLSDERVGQITRLPCGAGGDCNCEDSLMNMLHTKTRNCVRKARASGVVVSHSDSLGDLRTIADLHRENIGTVGGIAKPWSVFEAIQSTFTYDRDYRLYLGKKDGMVIAGLLVFFFNRTAEYYVPVTLADQRIHQPMSLLVFEAMRESVQRGCIYWNWGGTWLNQSGVYHFKKRWGTVDYPYRYHTRLFDERILDCSREQLLAEYPYFYVAPFGNLKGRTC